MENMNTLPNETIHITPRLALHLHDHRNKKMLVMKPFILMDLNNGIKFLKLHLLID
jgi:hypothetical protein